MSAAADAVSNRDQAMARAVDSSLLSPRFYRTDYAALDRMDTTPVQAEWDKLLQEFRDDGNRNHFERDEQFAAEVKELPPALFQEFLDFLISSVTAEFSGCVLYSEIKKHVRNPSMRELMGFMARDESRHAGFINKSLKDYGLQVDLAQLTKVKKYSYFSPKAIFYATYLSEKIGYARYITIFRHFERNPELRFHPIFRWFERWCNDEFRHGEAFALLLRLNPGLLKGGNKLWIRFFLLAVFATMYVRDHARPELYRGFGMDPTEYDTQVLAITSEITRQVFPFTLDLEHPRMRSGLERLSRLNLAGQAARERGGLAGRLKHLACGAGMALEFVRLYCLPTRPNQLPVDVRLSPAW